jgi:hypothetical protein
MSSPTVRRERHHLGTAALLLAAAAVAPLFGTATAAAQEDGPVRLRLDDTEGRSSTWVVRSRADISPPPGMGAQTTAERTMRIERTVESASGDTLRVAVRIDSFSVDLASDDEQVRSQLRQMEKQGRENVPGQTFRASVTRRGEIVETGGMAEGAPGAGQIDRTLRSLVFATLPEEPVSAGASWSDTLRTDASSFGVPVDGEVVTVTTSTLARISRRRGRRVAEIDVEGSFRFEQDTTAQAAMSIEMSGSAAQTIRFDVDRGLILGSSGAEDFTVNLSVPGQGSFAVQGTTESSAELVED